MSNKDNLLNANKKRGLPPRQRNIPAATDLPLSQDESKKEDKIDTKEVVDLSINNDESKEEIKIPTPTVELNTPTIDTIVSPEAQPIIQKVIVQEVKRGPGKPKKRKDGDKKISFWLDEDLVEGLFSSLSYGDSAGELINTAIREYQKNHNTYKAN